MKYCLNNYYYEILYFVLLDIIIVYYVLYVDLTGLIKPAQKEVVPLPRR